MNDTVEWMIGVGWFCSRRKEEEAKKKGKGRGKGRPSEKDKEKEKTVIMVKEDLHVHFSSADNYHMRFVDGSSDILLRSGAPQRGAKVSVFHLLVEVSDAVGRK